MSGIQLTGLASGFDWKNLVDQLMEVERIPITRIRSQQQQISRQLGGFSELTSKLGDLQQTIKTFSGDNLFARRLATVGNEQSRWTASASAGAPAGTYAIEVLKLATASSRQGAANASAPLSTDADVSGLTIAMANFGTKVTAGEITINGQRVIVDPSESLQDLFDRIDTATGGEVKASYDSATDTIKLKAGGPPGPAGNPIVLGSAADTSNFLMAAKLFNNGTNDVTSSGTLGRVDRSALLANAGLGQAIGAVDADGNGSFTINGEVFSFNVNEDRLKDIVERINNSAAGVQLTYDVANDSFTLTNSVTGNLGMSIEEEAGGLLAALGLTGTGASMEFGDNAEFRVDGGSVIVSQSNLLDETAHGIAGLTVTVDSTGMETIHVEPDNDAVREQIEEFIAKYNAVQDLIARQTRIEPAGDGEVRTSVFSGNREIGSLGNSLRNELFRATEVLNVGMRRLQNYGIDFARGTNRLEIADESVLTEAIEGRSDELRDLFLASGDGLVSRLDNAIENFTRKDGTASRQTEHLQRRNSDLDRQVANIERRLEQQRRMMESAFIAMEQAQSRIQQEMGHLLRMFEA